MVRSNQKDEGAAAAEQSSPEAKPRTPEEIYSKTLMDRHAEFNHIMRGMSNMFQSSYTGWGPENLGCMESDWARFPARKLFLAAHKGKVEQLQELLENPDLKKRVCDFDNDGMNILHILAFPSRKHGLKRVGEVVDVLVDAGVDVDTQSQMLPEHTPLEMAMQYSLAPLVEALLRHDPDIDFLDKKGNTFVERAWKICPHHGESTAACCQVLRMIEHAAEVSRPSREEMHEKADTLRKTGNHYFAQKDYARAREYYTDSIDLREDHRAYANRSLCSIELGRQAIRKAKSTCEDDYTPYSLEMTRWGKDALADTLRAIELEPSFEKAYYRKVIAQAMRRDFPRAKANCKQALEKFPDNAHLQRLLSKLEKFDIPDGFSNPFYYETECLPLLRAGAEYVVCNYCSYQNPIPLVESLESCSACIMPWKDFDTFDEFLALENSLRDFILEDE